MREIVTATTQNASEFPETPTNATVFFRDHIGCDTATSGRWKTRPETMTIEAIRNTQDARLKLFQKELDAADGDWKADHELAMKVLAFESALRFGIMIFDGLMELDNDEGLQAEVLRSEINAGHHDPVRDLLVDWLKPCASVETRIQEFLAAGFQVELAGEFRKRHEEAKWILSPAKEVFNHSKMVALRDEAIDALRRSDVSTECSGGSSTA